MHVMAGIYVPIRLAAQGKFILYTRSSPLNFLDESGGK